MERCFIIQPFDNGEFDKRFDEVISPAVTEVGLEPYRVDRDPSTKILYEDIQEEIKGSLLCLADITTDNPNVWFELGYALAKDKEVVMICAESRDKFPFDIQHRSIVTYKTSSPSDFDVFKSQIVEKIKASIERVNRNKTIEEISTTKPTEGFTPHEITAIAVVISGSFGDPEGFSGHQIANEMEKAGFNKVATSLSLTSLKHKGFIQESQVEDDQGYSYLAYNLSQKGEVWALQNQEKLGLKVPNKNPPPWTGDDDIPF